MKNILIIEDNAEIRENTAELLGLSDYSVLIAENGDEGFILAKKHKPDAILCDMMMPASNGREFLRLAKNDTVVGEIPFVFFSADSASAEIKKGLVKGAAGYLRKPFTEQQLLDTIKKALAK